MYPISHGSFQLLVHNTPYIIDRNTVLPHVIYEVYYRVVTHCNDIQFVWSLGLHA